MSRSVLRYVRDWSLGPLTPERLGYGVTLWLAAGGVLVAVEIDLDWEAS